MIIFCFLQARQTGQADLSSLQVLPRHPVCSRVCVPRTDEPGKVLGSDKDGQCDDCDNCCPVSSHNNLGKILDEGEQPVGGELQEAHEVQEQRGRREPIFQDGSPYQHQEGLRLGRGEYVIANLSLFVILVSVQRTPDQSLFCNPWFAVII